MSSQKLKQNFGCQTKRENQRSNRRENQRSNSNDDKI
jgi:hypothetical protein